MRFPIIYADPPWAYRDKAQGKGVHGRYDTLTPTELAALPVAKLAADDSLLFLWVTPPTLLDGLSVASAWGFRYVTKAFCWVKRTKTGKQHFGMGTITRANTEDVLVFRRGRGVRPAARNVRQVVEAQVREHSRKPEEVRDRIDAMFSHLPRVELFARQQVRDWSVWGHQVESSVRLTATLPLDSVAPDAR